MHSADAGGGCVNVRFWVRDSCKRVGDTAGMRGRAGFEPDIQFSASRDHKRSAAANVGEYDDYVVGESADGGVFGKTSATVTKGFDKNTTKNNEAIMRQI